MVKAEFLKASLLLGSATVAASCIMVSPAMADAPIGFAGALSGMYGQSSSRGDGFSTSSNSYGVSGSAAYGFDIPNFAAQIDGNYGHTSEHAFDDTDAWGIGGSLFWANGVGRVGATIHYDRNNFLGAGSGFSTHSTSYGVFGEYYINDFVTLGAKAGWFREGDNSNFGCGGEGQGSCIAKGVYVGGAATGYLMPDFALWAAVDYLTINDGGHVTSATLGAEYLFSEELPVSAFGSFTRTETSDGGGRDDAWLIGVKYYFNGNGTTLRDRQRNGSLGWIGSPNQNLR